MVTILFQTPSTYTVGFGRRISSVFVGIDYPRRELPAQGFGQKALCCGRVLLGREEKVEGRAGRIHRTIQVAPLAFDPM